MKKLEKILTEVEKVVDVICDRCGKSCLDQYGYNHEYASVTASWGYGSHKDTESHLIELCESCYDYVIVLLQLKPQISSYHV